MTTQRQKKCRLCGKSIDSRDQEHPIHRGLCKQCGNQARK